MFAATMNESNASALLLTRTSFVPPVLNVSFAERRHTSGRVALLPTGGVTNGGQNIQASNLLHEGTANRKTERPA